MDANSQSKTKFIVNFDGQVAKMFNKRPVYERQYPLALVQTNGLSNASTTTSRWASYICLFTSASSTKRSASVASSSVKVEHKKQQNRTIST